MDNILFRKSWFKTLKRWEPQKVYDFICSLERFSQGEQVNISDDRLLDFWDQVEPLLISDKNRYETKVETNRENGKLGGRPKKDSNKTQENPTVISETQENQTVNSETQPNPKNPKEKDKDKEKDKEKEKDTLLDNILDKELDKEFNRENLFKHIPGFIESMNINPKTESLDEVDDYIDKLFQSKLG
jgi:hypothetical protein